MSSEVSIHKYFVLDFSILKSYINVQLSMYGSYVLALKISVFYKQMLYCVCRCGKESSWKGLN